MITAMLGVNTRTFENGIGGPENHEKCIDFEEQLRMLHDVEQMQRERDAAIHKATSLAVALAETKETMDEFIMTMTHHQEKKKRRSSIFPPFWRKSSSGITRMDSLLQEEDEQDELMQLQATIVHQQFRIVQLEQQQNDATNTAAINDIITIKPNDLSTLSLEQAQQVTIRSLMRKIELLEEAKSGMKDDTLPRSTTQPQMITANQEEERRTNVEVVQAIDSLENENENVGINSDLVMEKTSPFVDITTPVCEGSINTHDTHDCGFGSDDDSFKEAGSIKNKNEVTRLVDELCSHPVQTMQDNHKNGRQEAAEGSRTDEPIGLPALKKDDSLHRGNGELTSKTDDDNQCQGQEAVVAAHHDDKAADDEDGKAQQHVEEASITYAIMHEEDQAQEMAVVVHHDNKVVDDEAQHQPEGASTVGEENGQGLSSDCSTHTNASDTTQYDDGNKGEIILKGNHDGHYERNGEERKKLMLFSLRKDAQSTRTWSMTCSEQSTEEDASDIMSVTSMASSTTSVVLQDKRLVSEVDCANS